MIQLFIHMEQKFMSTWNKVHVKIEQWCTHNMYLKLSCWHVHEYDIMCTWYSSCEPGTKIMFWLSNHVIWYMIYKSVCQPGTKFLSRLSNHVDMICIWDYHVNIYMNMISCVHDIKFVTLWHVHKNYTCHVNVFTDFILYIYMIFYHQAPLRSLFRFVKFMKTKFQRTPRLCRV